MKGPLFGVLIVRFVVHQGLSWDSMSMKIGLGRVSRSYAIRGTLNPKPHLYPLFSIVGPRC